MKTLYFDLNCGASGDMILSSLIDIGFPVRYLEEQLAKLQIEQIHIGVQKVNRNGIMCTYITPEWQEAKHYRHLGEILDLIKKGNFSDQVFSRSERVLDRLATAEAQVHGIPKDHVHFHEIGAVDTIIDVLGVSLALEYLKIDKIKFSAITEGHGFIQTEHGTIPVPVPATAQMIQGYDVKFLDIDTEILTPTGAALLTALGEQVSGNFTGTICNVGYGCGTKVFQKYSNILRAMIFESQSDDTDMDTVYLLETDMDHISGELMGHVAQLLLDNGALDVSWVPLFMKKGRPGYRLSVIASMSNYNELTDIIMINTRTLGIRRQLINRVISKRKSLNYTFMEQALT
ncbi:MAG: nickel pincer cofactor biosynthesis protein LarC, partial [Fibrobacter sp.]|nr:nickel pincer cofactor biosynthesis protein LarC [Fibrobacter sp.]